MPGGEGDTIYKWPDDSGNDYHADNVQGNPTLKVSALNGHSVIAFDGSDDLLWTSQNFDGLANGYTLFTVSRYAGNPKGRVIGSKTQNWFWGYHHGGVHKWHPNGWVSNHGGGDTNWHIHSGDINNAGDPQANFWTDGAQKATNHKGSNNTNYKPGLMSFGGLWHGSNNEFSNSEVAEVVMYNRVLSKDEREMVEAYLSQKYDFTHPRKAKIPKLITILLSLRFSLVMQMVRTTKTSASLFLTFLQLKQKRQQNPVLYSGITHGTVKTTGNDKATVRVYYGNADGGKDVTKWRRISTVGIY